MRGGSQGPPLFWCVMSWRWITEEKRCQEELLARLRLDITFPQHRTVSGSGQKIILTLLIPLAGHAQDVLLKETHDLWHR